MTRRENYYLMTNIKGGLMLLLVLYHTVSVRLASGEFHLENLTVGDSWLGIIFMTALSAVPLFVMISGYYSKDTDSFRDHAFANSLIPYIILQAASMLFFGIIYDGKVQWDMFLPYYQLWYLLSLFIWGITLKDIVRLKGAFAIMLFLSLIVGAVVNLGRFSFNSGMNAYMSLYHTLAFYPFLLIGYYLRPEHVEKIRNMNALWGVLALILYAVISTLFTAKVMDITDVYGLLLLKCDKDYIYNLLKVNSDGSVSGINSYTLAAVAGIAYRLIHMLCVMLIGIAAIRFMPKKKVAFLTQLGTASLTVYCLHTFIVIPIGNALPANNAAIYVLSVIVTAVAASWLLSLNAIHKRYSKFILFAGDKLFKK